MTTVLLIPFSHPSHGSKQRSSDDPLAHVFPPPPLASTVMQGRFALLQSLCFSVRNLPTKTKASFLSCISFSLTILPPSSSSSIVRFAYNSFSVALECSISIKTAIFDERRCLNEIITCHKDKTYKLERSSLKTVNFKEKK